MEENCILTDFLERRRHLPRENIKKRAALEFVGRMHQNKEMKWQWQTLEAPPAIPSRHPHGFCMARHVIRHASSPPLFLGDFLATRQALSQLGPGCVSVLQDQCRVA